MSGERNVQIGGNAENNDIQIGNGNSSQRATTIINNNYRGADAPAIAARRTWTPVVLPYPSLETLFKGREEVLTDLHARLHGEGEGHATAIVGKALHGLGGVGKTRLAVEYARRYAQHYTALLLVSADSPEELRRNLAGLAGKLQLPEREVAEEEARVKAVVADLNVHPGWLLILDNADTTEAAAAAEALLGKLHGGWVLITSRNTQWSGAVETLPLDVLSEDAAAEFLLQRTERGRRKLSTDEADAKALAKELDGLALALEQAGAYIANRRVSLEAYLRDWRAHDATVQGWHNPQLMQYPRSVAVTWEITLRQLGACEAALQRLLAWLAPDPIPGFLLESDETPELLQAAVDLLCKEKPEYTPATRSVRDTLVELANFNLVRLEAVKEWESLSIHRVVREIIRHQTPQILRREWWQLALSLLDVASQEDPQDINTWKRWEPLHPHVALVVGEGEEYGTTDVLARLIQQLGKVFFYGGLTLHPKDEHLLRLALAIDEEIYGYNHPLTVVALSNLGQLTQATNRLEEAELLLRRALIVDEALYDPNHTRISIHLNNLANLLQNTNRLQEAEPLMRRALMIDEITRGPSHPFVAIRLNNLGTLLQDTNRLEEAELLMRRALAIDEASYGPVHPYVAAGLNNLAVLLQDTHRLEEAERLMRRALAIDEANYGPNHFNVSRDLNNLAQQLKASGRLEEAEPMMRRALAIDEASYGPAHPHVATDLNNLAQLLKATGRMTEAEPLMRRALAIDEASLDIDHPNIAIRLYNLAHLLKGTNQLTEAEPLMRRAVEIWLEFGRRTGHGHPRLGVALSNYKMLLQELGRSEAEVEALRTE